MLTIDPKFVDYDFTKDPNYVQGYTGKQTDSMKACMASYGDVAHVYTDAQLKEAAAKIKDAGGSASRLVTRILNQSQEGSCVGNGSTQGNQIVQAKQFGRDRVVQLSAMSLYKRIGRSAQSGAVVSDAWKEMQDRGIIPLDTPENKERFKHTHPATGFSKPLPQGWEETAAMFKGLEATIIDSMAELLSALVDGFPVIVGREGHCICYCDPLFEDGKWHVVYANSWGKWGQAAGHMEYGFGVDTESQIKKSSDWAYAIRSVTTPTFQLQTT